jgi:3-hydroxyisobutyrate dehydrogenase
MRIMQKLKIGIVGLGNMGRGIANNYVRAKVPLAVWDVSSPAIKPFRKLQNVEVAEPARMAGMCSIIFFVVPGSAEIEAALKGKDGVLAHARPGLVLYDLTTSAPAATKKLARMAAKKGIAYLDAGMSGGAAGAEAGTLTLMIGGDERAGKSGAGHTLKLIHNMVCHTIFLTTEVFNVSNARSYISQFRFPRHILSKKWDAKSRVYNLHKDLGMAVTLANDLGADVSLGERTLAFLDKAVDQGMIEKDFSLLYRDFEKIRKGSSGPKGGKRRKTDKQKAG